MRLFAGFVMGLALLSAVVFAADLPPATSSDFYTLFEPIPEGAAYASFNVIELREPVFLLSEPVIITAIDLMPPATSSDFYTLFE